MKIHILLGALLLTSCTTVHTLIGPDGTQNHLIGCSEIESCYEKAREVCKGNYKIVNTSAETTGMSGTTETTTKLLVKCEQ